MEETKYTGMHFEYAQAAVAGSKPCHLPAGISWPAAGEKLDS